MRWRFFLMSALPPPLSTSMFSGLTLPAFPVCLSNRESSAGGKQRPQSFSL